MIFFLVQQYLHRKMSVMSAYTSFVKDIDSLIHSFLCSFLVSLSSVIRQMYLYLSNVI